MPVQGQVSKARSGPTNQADQIFERFLLAVDSYDKAAEHQAELQGLKSSFADFYDGKFSDIQSQRQEIAKRSSTSNPEEQKLRERLLEQSIELFARGRKEMLEPIQQMESRLAAATQEYQDQLASVTKLISELSPSQRQELFTQTSQMSEVVDGRTQQLYRFRALVSRTIAPNLSPLGREYQLFAALRTLELAKKELQIWEKTDSPNRSALDRKKHTAALSNHVREKFRTLTEQERQEYIVLARRHCKEAAEHRRTHDHFDIRELAHIESRLPDIVPGYNDDLIDDTLAVSKDAEESFTAFLREVGDLSLSLRSASFPESYLQVATLRSRLAKNQQRIVDSFFSQRSEEERKLCVSEAQRRLDSKVVRPLTRDFTTWDLDRPIESRFEHLIPGVKQREKQLLDAVEELSSESLLSGDLQTQFNSMIAELQKLHRLETVVQGADNTTRKNVAQVYQDAADEIRGMLDRDALIAGDGMPQDSELADVRLHNFDARLQSSNRQLDEHLSAFSNFLETGRLESFRVTDEEIFVRSGKMEEAVKQGAEFVRDHIPSTEQLTTVFVGSIKLQQNGVQLLTETLVNLAGKIPHVPSRSPQTLDSLVMPKAKVEQTTPEQTAPQAISNAQLAKLPEGVAKEIGRLNELLASLQEEREEPIPPEELYNSRKYYLWPAKDALVGYHHQQVLSTLSTKVIDPSPETERPAAIRSLRSLADAQQQLFEMDQDAKQPAFAEFVLTSLQDPDRKFYQGPSHSPLTDALKKAGESVTNDPAETAQFVRSYLDTLPKQTRETYSRCEEDYQRHTTTIEQRLSLQVDARSYDKITVEDVKSDIEKLLSYAAELSAHQ